VSGGGWPDARPAEPRPGRLSTMRLRRTIIGITGGALALVALGFVLFANAVTREPEVQDVHADATWC
jgi:hypothetical protein